LVENRRGDWESSVNDRLVSLTSAQKTTDDELDEIQAAIARDDRILRGDPEEDHEGLQEAINRHQVLLNKLNAILNPDSLGNGGLLNDVRDLKKDRDRSEKREGYIWKFATAVVVQFLILTGLLVVNWDNIAAFIVLHEHIYQAAAIEKDTKKRKVARAHRKHKVVLDAPEPQAEPALNTEEDEDNGSTN
jgi:hypothetical protein